MSFRVPTGTPPLSSTSKMVLGCEVLDGDRVVAQGPVTLSRVAGTMQWTNERPVRLVAVHGHTVFHRLLRIRWVCPETGAVVLAGGQMTLNGTLSIGDSIAIAPGDFGLHVQNQGRGR